MCVGGGGNHIPQGRRHDLRRHPDGIKDRPLLKDAGARFNGREHIIVYVGGFALGPDRDYSLAGCLATVTSSKLRSRLELATGLGLDFSLYRINSCPWGSVAHPASLFGSEPWYDVVCGFLIIGL